MQVPPGPPRPVRRSGEHGSLPIVVKMALAALLAVAVAFPIGRAARHVLRVPFLAGAPVLGATALLPDAVFGPQVAADLAGGTMAAATAAPAAAATVRPAPAAASPATPAAASRPTAASPAHPRLRAALRAARSGNHPKLRRRIARWWKRHRTLRAAHIRARTALRALRSASPQTPGSHALRRRLAAALAHRWRIRQECRHRDRRRHRHA